MSGQRSFILWRFSVEAKEALAGAKLETAQIYTQISTRQLKEVHTTRIRARLTLDAELAEQEAELADEEHEA